MSATPVFLIWILLTPLDDARVFAWKIIGAHETREACESERNARLDVLRTICAKLAPMPPEGSQPYDSSEPLAAKYESPLVAKRAVFPESPRKREPSGRRRPCNESEPCHMSHPIRASEP